MLLRLGKELAKGWQERVAGRMWMSSQKVLWWWRQGDLDLERRQEQSVRNQLSGRVCQGRSCSGAGHWLPGLCRSLAALQLCAAAR